MITQFQFGRYTLSISQRDIAYCDDETAEVIFFDEKTSKKYTIGKTPIDPGKILNGIEPSPNGKAHCWQDRDDIQRILQACQNQLT